MRHPVFGRVMPDVSNDHIVFFYRVPFSQLISQCVSIPGNNSAKILRIIMNYLPINTITSQKNWIFIIIIIIIVVVFVVVVATCLWATRERNRVWDFNMTGNIFSFLGLKFAHIYWSSGGIFPGVKRLERKAPPNRTSTLSIIWQDD